jgi:hypothetical protein
MRDILNEFKEKHNDFFTYDDFKYVNNKQWITYPILSPITLTI